MPPLQAERSVWCSSNVCVQGVYKIKSPKWNHTANQKQTLHALIYDQINKAMLSQAEEPNLYQRKGIRSILKLGINFQSCIPLNLNNAGI